MKLTIIIFLLISSTALAEPSMASTEQPAAQSPNGRTLCFVENRGQAQEGVHYYIHGADRALFFKSNEVFLALADKSGRSRRGVALDFVDADVNVAPCGENRQKATYSFFSGDQANWRSSVPTFQRLVYRDLWPGIDLVYSGTADRLKYEFIVKPGADPDQIQLRYRGAEEVSVTKNGTMLVRTGTKTFEDDTPYAYQKIDGAEKAVTMKYALEKRAEDGAVSFGFEIGSYDATRTLVLDPASPVYCGYIGGVSSETAYGITVDSEGCAYITGFTDSWTGFPLKVGPDLSLNGLHDAFVAKVDALGEDLIYCGVIGGHGEDFGYSIAVDEQGYAYVTGKTSSDHNSFPVLLGPDTSYNGGKFDAFVARVNPSGESLDYCGYIGGLGEDIGNDIAIDSMGSALVTGTTDSNEGSFPVLMGPDLTFNGGLSDAFVARVHSIGSVLDYCGYLGGMGRERGNGIAVGPGEFVFLTGYTESWPGPDPYFPVKKGPSLACDADGDIYVAKMDPWPSSQVPVNNYDYCGYITGNSYDEGRDIAVDAEGCAYVTGSTNSPHSCFMVTKGPDVTVNGKDDAFVAKVKADPSHAIPKENLHYCGYVGGASADHGHGIAVDSQGRAVITGTTGSPSGEDPWFPATDNGLDPSFNGGQCDAFVAMVIPNPVNAAPKDNLVYSGYIGGLDWEEGFGIALDANGDAYITGGTWSSETTESFPVLVGPDLTYNGYRDAFVTKIAWNEPMQGSFAVLPGRMQAKAGMSRP